MHAVTLDTFSIIKSLKEAGFNDLQIEGQVHVLQQLFEKTQEQAEEIKKQDKAATKQDVKQIENELILKIESIHTKTEIKKEKINSALQLELAKIDVKIEKVRSEIWQAKNSTILWTVSILGTALFAAISAQTVFLFDVFEMAIKSQS